MKRRVLWHLGEIGLLLGLHLFLIRYMADNDIVSVVFSAGAHAPHGVLLAAGGFLLVRFLVVLFLPSMILSRAALLWFRWHHERTS